MDDRIVQKTQDTLGKVIKKPPLTEKLLKKPPFRFLHDIMTSVIKTTGFMKGLFTDLEMQSDNVKDKESKVAFLQKAIDIVSLATGKELSVKPSKVVAGHEPEKTNEFLQALASAVSKKSKNDELVQQVLNKGAGSSSSKKEKKEDRDSSADRRERSSKRDRDDKRSREKDSENKSRDRDGDKENRDESRRKRSEKRDSVDSGKPDKEKIKQEDDKPPKPEKSLRENGHPSAEPADKQDESDEDEDGQAAKIPRPASAKGSRRRQREKESERSREREEEKPAEEETRETRERPAPARRSARPSSARPAPPKPKAQKETVPEPEIRLGSGKPVTQVIVDDAQNSDDDDNFVVEEGGPPEPPPPQKLDVADAENDGDHGGLVKKILETKKELEGGSQQPQAKKVEIEKPAMSDVARRKEREMVVKEVDALRTAIQTLTRSANPLGKIMDYVQEDMDSMQKELEKWKQENKEHALALKREQGVTESSIEPLKGQLAELDESIANQLVMIAASKANILRNDAKITKMLGSVTKS